MKKYCIFDMDGTLVDSMGYWDMLQEEILTAKGVTEGLEEAINECRHLTLYDSAVYFIDHLGLPETPEELEAEMNEAMAEHYRNDVQPRPGVEAFLRRMQEQGAVMCVATCTAERLARACLDRLGFGKYLQFVLSCEEVGYSKERPDVFLEAVRRMGGTVEESVIFEDSLPSVQTAKAAGFSVVGIFDVNNAETWPQLSALADRAIMSWEDLL